MAKQQQSTATSCEEIRSIMEHIAEHLNSAGTDASQQDGNKGINGYVSQRCIIDKVFQCGGYSFDDVKLRLTVIDSLYSTNAEQFNYFAIDDMADSIIKNLGSRTAARGYFDKIACGGKDVKNLFSQHFGIKKNLKTGPEQMSLLSKYAFYELRQAPNSYPLGFPIYDSIVKKMYPKVCRVLGIPINSLSQGNNSKIRIEDYVKCIEQLRSVLFGQQNPSLFHGFQQFDILDVYLWRMGKFSAGNLSLLLSKADYVKFINNIGLSGFVLQNNITFETAVLRALRNPNVQPFNGCGSQPYLDTLLAHWRKFY